MPTEDPKITLDRQRYVQKMIAKQQTEKQKSTQELQFAQKIVLDCLSQSNLDQLIRQKLKEFHCSFKATKIIKDQVPLSGCLLSSFQPIFIIDHQGLVGFSKRYEYPGLEYIFYLGLDEVVIHLNLCQSPNAPVIAVISITHRNGRTHQIDHQSIIANPSDLEFINWLNLEFYEFFPSKNLFEDLLSSTFSQTNSP